VTAQSQAGLSPSFEGGFTLVELLVATAAGIVVLFALTSIMIVTLHQTQRTFTRIDATRQARTALAVVENELHSACTAGAPLGQSDPPVLPGSDDNNLSFLSFYGTAATPTPVWHQLSFSSTAGTLTDTSYPVTGTGPAWTKGTTSSAQTTLLSNVAAQAGTPVFQYYAYTLADTDAAGAGYYTIPDGSSVDPLTGAAISESALSTSPAGLNANDAGNVVEVSINLLVGPSDNLTKSSVGGITDPVTDTISLRFTTPPNYLPAKASTDVYSPCQ
jgi:Tfp pilus assembly protein PilW